MKLFVALLPALLSLGSATTLTERRNSELQQRASCSDPQQYYCRYGFCCGYAESCDVGGCNGGSSGAARCSRQGVSGQIAVYEFMLTDQFQQICGSRSGYVRTCRQITVAGDVLTYDSRNAATDSLAKVQDRIAME